MSLREKIYPWKIIQVSFPHKRTCVLRLLETNDRSTSWYITLSPLNLSFRAHISRRHMSFEFIRSHDDFQPINMHCNNHFVTILWTHIDTMCHLHVLLSVRIYSIKYSTYAQITSIHTTIFAIWSITCCISNAHLSLVSLVLLGLLYQYYFLVFHIDKILSHHKTHIKSI